MAYCPNCGAPHDNQAKFCPNCGQKLPLYQNVPPYQPNSYTPQSRIRNSNKLLVFGIPVVTVLVIVSIIFINYQHNKVTYTKNNKFLGEWQCVDMTTGNIFGDLFGNAITSYTDATISFTSDGKVNAKLFDIAAGKATYTLSKNGKTATFRIDEIIFIARLQGKHLIVTAEGNNAFSMTFEKSYEDY